MLALGATLQAQCSPTSGAARAAVPDMTYTLFDNSSDMVTAYQSLAYLDAGALVQDFPSVPCRAGWKVGDCTWGGPYAHLLSYTDHGAPHLLASYPASAVLLDLTGRPRGESALLAYFRSGAGAPLNPSPLPPPATRLRNMVPVAYRPTCSTVAGSPRKGIIAAVACRVGLPSVAYLYYDLFSSGAAMDATYRSTVDGRAGWGSGCPSPWGTGECPYRTGGRPAGRSLQITYKGYPWLIWTSDRLDVVVQAGGRLNGGARLKRYWETGAANPV